MKIAAVIMLIAVFLVSGCAGRLATLTEPPAVSQWLSECGQWDEWDKPGPPFRIHGNTYYVGTCGIASMLIATDRGHVLIDSGTREGAEHVVHNVESLGLRVEDISVLLHSHEHFDHVGGLSYLQRLSDARLLTSKAASQVLATGKDSPGDPQYGLHPAFEAANVDGNVRHGQRIRVGGLHFTAIETPGHTPGALSWHWQSCDELSCVNVVYADSLSPISRDGY
ncbi:MAG: metallo-beta-lactamase, partial [Pseudomonadota bacterium]